MRGVIEQVESSLKYDAMNGSEMEKAIFEQQVLELISYAKSLESLQKQMSSKKQVVSKSSHWIECIDENV
jgi:hypothetical protein